MERRNYLTIALLSVTLIALELTWTRLFSAEFFYTFAFLVLSLAVLGLGMGGLAVRLAPPLGREGALGWILALTGLLTALGPILVFRLGLRFSEVPTSWAMAGKLVLTILILGSAFFTGGIALAGLFRRLHADMPRLYMADLLGAAAGVIVAVGLMNWVGTPEAALLVSLPVFLAALLAARGWARLVPLVLVGTVAAQMGSAPRRLEVERPARAPIIYKHWDAMGKIKVYDFAENYRGIEIDNVANSPVYGFDGNWDRPDSLKFEFGIDVSNLIGRFDHCVFLSLGAGGGVDVLQALQAGATEVHAVEVNPHINRMMTVGDPKGYLASDPVPEDAGPGDGAAAEESPPDSVRPSDPPPEDVPDSTPPGSSPPPITLAEFSGHIYSDPRVRVVSEDARAYAARHENTFDVIYSLSSNTFAAIASGSFAMAESYLFTVGAFRDYWNALSDDGFLMMEHQFYMPRLISALSQALIDLGVPNWREHLAVYDLPNMRRKMVLLSKRPLTDEIRTSAFGELTPEMQGYAYLLYPPAADSLRGNLIDQIVMDGWRAAQDSARIAVSPSTDDRPFVGQMGLWRNISRESLKRPMFLEVYGFPLSKILILTILVVILVLTLPLTFLPYLRRPARLPSASTPGSDPAETPHLRAAAWFYFFLIGAAFMIVEVLLIQKQTLFIGPSAYSVAVILLGLLLGSGIGSRFTAKFRPPVAFLGIVALLLAEVIGFRPVTAQLIGLPLEARMAVSLLFVLPLGFFMGMPFPIGALRVGDKIDWGFAVNGVGSVFGSTAILLVAMDVGLNAGLLVGGLCYLGACGVLSLRRAW